jgi:hypothetical protein
MKFGRLLLQLLEQMPVEYRDKFLSYKQLKKVINTILKDNSLPVAAFVELPEAVREEDGGEGERASVEVVTARDVEVAWPLAEGGSLERAGKRARGEEGVSAVAGAEEGKGGEGDGAAAAVGTKRKAGGGGGGEAEGDVPGVDAGGNVAAVPVQGEVGAVRAGEEKELSKEEEDFLHLLNVELEKFNHFFTEKEEDYVIRLQVRRATSSLSRCFRLQSFAEL